MKYKILFLIVGITFFAGLSSFSPLKYTDIVDDVLIQTNQFRKSKGLPALISREELNTIAQKHSEDMAAGKVAFGHDGFEKRNMLAREKIGTFYSFAENVAYGAYTGKQAVTMWRNSSGHRRNMLGAYKYIGIGIATDSYGTIYFTQIFAG